MATYTELFALRTNTDLRNRIAVAVAIKAQALIDGSPTAAQVNWAKEAIANPVAKADDLFIYLLAKNNAATVAQIEAVQDATIQTAINAAVDVLVSGGS